MDKQITEILRAATQDPTYKSLMDYLMLRRAVPDMQFGYAGDAVMGEFRTNSAGLRGSDLGPAGKITLAVGKENKELGKSTVIHELAHAALRQISNQYYQRKYYDEPATPNPFREAYRRIEFGGNYNEATADPRKALVKSFPGGAEYLKANSGYRGTAEELNAFAVGNAVGDRKAIPLHLQSNAPAHIDPTVATEFMLLLDAAMRDMKANPGPQGR